MSPLKIMPDEKIRVKNVIAVGSGKGGVGKSTVAANLSLALQQEGHSVGLLDADIYGPSIPMMMGVQGAKPQFSPEGKILPIPAHGIATMSIGFIAQGDQAIIWRGPMIHKILDEFLSRVEWGSLDYLIVDLPPGTGDAQLSLSQLIPLTGAVAVTTPQEVSLADVRRAVEMFRKVRIPVLGVIENMSYYICGKCHERTEIFSAGGGERAAKEWQTTFLGGIPLVTDVRVGGDRGVPIVVSDPRSEISGIFRNIARNLSNVIHDAHLQVSQEEEHPKIFKV